MLAKKSRIKHKNIHGDEAQGMVEFAIVFPILFLFFLAICQTAMLYTAREVVQYAAFAAVRSAVVWIPETMDINGTSSIGPAFQISNKVKLNKVETAAALACTSIAPSVGFTDYVGFVAGFAELLVDINSELGIGGSENYFLLAGMVGSAPDIITHCAAQVLKFDINNMQGDATIALVLAGMGLLINDLDGQDPSQKYIYSRFFTAVNFYEPGTDSKFGSNRYYSAGEDITVEVTHFYSMKVPVVNKLIYMAYMTNYLPRKLAEKLESSGYSKSQISSTLKELEEKMDEIMSQNDLSFYPIPIRARSTLSVEGNLSWS